MNNLKDYIIKDSINKEGMIKTIREYPTISKYQRLFNSHYVNIKQKYRINIKTAAHLRLPKSSVS